jgi:elongation factor P
MKVSANSLKQGNVIIFDNRLCVIIKAPEHVKPGKGPAYVQLEMKDLKSAIKLNQRISSSDQIEKAYLETKEYQFLYEQGSELCFMAMDDFEQIQLDKSLIDKNLLPFLQQDMLIKIESFDGSPINFIFPTNVVLEIKETEAVIKGSTSAPSYKPALMENGITVKVPAYLTSGEKIIIKVEDGSFVERASK